MKYAIGEIKDGRIEDYRIDTKDNTLAYKKGRLKDFKQGFIINSKGLGDLLGCMNNTFEWSDDLMIIEYSGGYALGK